MKILVLNGPNLGLLGTREPEIYGKETLDDIMDALRQDADALGVELMTVQTDSEGEMVSAIGKAKWYADGIILNPAAYTHTSVAIHDAIKGCMLPTVEVHLSNVYAREGYRHESITAGVCVGQICGFGPLGYRLALEALIAKIEG